MEGIICHLYGTALLFVILVLFVCHRHLGTSEDCSNINGFRIIQMRHLEDDAPFIDYIWIDFFAFDLFAINRSRIVV